MMMTKYPFMDGRKLNVFYFTSERGNVLSLISLLFGMKGDLSFLWQESDCPILP